MSATLGGGGELERSLGITRIEYLPIPPEWERQGSGRRLALFPSLSLEPEEINELLCKLLSLQPRALVLCPDAMRAERVREILRECPSSYVVLSKSEIENSLRPFVQQDNAVLLLTSRYDGIDLPDEACRLQIVYEDPAALNIQERFYLERLAADHLLRNRTSTRIAQALGRCVRNANDYALVVMVGERLSNFCSRRETLVSLHPEMQAELEFGLNQSQEQSLDGFIEMAKLFLTRDEKWQEADAGIRVLREMKERRLDDSLGILGEIAGDEVRFGRSFWSRNFDDAQQYAQSIIDRLSNHELSPYRGWWHYLAGVIAFLRDRDVRDESALTLARSHFDRAAGATATVSWLASLRAVTRQSSGAELAPDQT
ncbi:MAG: hypothetical protein MN733_22590, partial [Nitrososphaera sp.]|nr:hypothetical protein [Nitrososphaera sp.]